MERSILHLPERSQDSHFPVPSPIKYRQVREFFDYVLYLDNHFTYSETTLLVLLR